MISEILTIDAGVVKPTIHCHTIPELKNLIEKYPTRHADMLAYCFYTACPYKSENPYADFSDDEREDILKRDFVVFPDNQDILDAVDKLRKLYSTTISKYLMKNKRNLEDIMDYIDASPVIDGKDGNLADRIKIAEKCGKIMAEYIQLEGQAEEEKNKLKTRANRKTGLGELD